MNNHDRDDIFLLNPAIGITGRVLFTLIFFLSGITHFTNLREYAALMPPEIPWRSFWVIVSAFFELAGAAMILFNRSPRLGGWLIAIFLLPVTITVHGTGIVRAPDPLMRGIQTSFFLKGLAMMGAALLISQMGVRAPGSVTSQDELPGSPLLRSAAQG